MSKIDILERLANSSVNESSHELQCRCFDAAEEISRLRSAIGNWLDARNAPITGMFGIAERDAIIKAEVDLENAFLSSNRTAL